MVGPKMADILRIATFEQQKWQHIRQVAANDPILKEMFDQIEMYYTLKYDSFKNEIDKLHKS
jgi:hypothetical protein